MAAQLIPNSDITIYNKYFVSRAEVYQRFEVYDVVWQSTDAISRAKEQVASNSALIMIPFARGGDYVQPKAWQALLDKSSVWTLQEGDIVVRGIAVEEITAGYSVSSLRADYNDVVMITAIAAMNEGSPNVQHWEVNAK